MILLYFFTFLMLYTKIKHILGLLTTDIAGYIRCKITLNTVTACEKNTGSIKYMDFSYYQEVWSQWSLNNGKFNE